MMQEAWLLDKHVGHTKIHVALEQWSQKSVKSYTCKRADLTHQHMSHL